MSTRNRLSWLCILVCVPARARTDLYIFEVSPHSSAHTFFLSLQCLYWSWFVKFFYSCFDLPIFQCYIGLVSTLFGQLTLAFYVEVGTSPVIIVIISIIHLPILSSASHLSSVSSTTSPPLPPILHTSMFIARRYSWRYSIRLTDRTIYSNPSRRYTIQDNLMKSLSLFDLVSTIF